LPGARMSNVHASQQANVFRCGRNGEKGRRKVTVGAGIDLVVRSEPARDETTSLLHSYLSAPSNGLPVRRNSL
jgi:hypothetical protein